MTRAPSRSKLTHSRSAPTVLRGAAQAATANNPEHDEAEPWRRGRVGFLAFFIFIPIFTWSFFCKCTLIPSSNTKCC